MSLPRVAILGTKSSCLALISAVVQRGEVTVSVIVTLDDSSDTRSRLPDLRRLADAHALPIIVAPTTAQAYSAVAASSANVVLVAGWYRIIPVSILESVAQGFFGMHYSRLPSYRGSAPVVWAMINGEPEIGYSIFRMSEGMDEGLLAAQGSVALADGCYVAEAIEAVDVESTRVFAAMASALATGTQRLFEQPVENLSYGSVRTPLDGRIDWNVSAQRIERWVHAQSKPYPGAFAYLGDDRVIVWRAREETASKYFGPPGQVVRVIGTCPVVACADGTGLLIEELESERPSASGNRTYSLAKSRFH